MRKDVRLGAAIVVLSVVAVGAATLTPSRDSAPGRLTACIVCEEQGLADALANIILFLPLGVGLAMGRVRLPLAALAGLVVSASVELAQITLIQGRDSSAGDVLFNTVGTVLGYGLRSLVGVAARLSAGIAARISIAAALMVGLGVALTGWLLEPSFPRTTYWAHQTPRLGHLQWYRGQVQHARIAGRGLSSPQIEDSEWVRQALLAGAPIEVEFTGGLQVSGLASLFNISDSHLREIVLLGPDRRDLVFRYRTRAQELRLDQPDVRVPGAWSVASGEPSRARAWSPSRGRWCLALGQAVHCDLGFTAGVAWSFLFYAERFPPALQRALSVAWIAGLTLPVGFFLRRRWETGAAVAILVLATLVLPGRVGLLNTSLGEWAGAAFGLAAGGAAAWGLRRSGPGAREQSG